MGIRSKDTPSARVVSSTATDRGLVAEAVAGSRSAFTTLVQRHEGQIHALLERLCGCHETARDLAQETFVSAFKNLHTFQHRSEFFTWLYRIACNHAFTARRRPNAFSSGLHDPSRATSAHAGSPAAQPCEPVAPDTDVSARLDQEELRQQLANALGQIDDRFRQVVVLCDMQGASYEETAEILEVPIGTVRSRLHRGRTSLRQILADL